MNKTLICLHVCYEHKKVKRHREWIGLEDINEFDFESIDDMKLEVEKLYDVKFIESICPECNSKEINTPLTVFKKVYQPFP